MQPLSLILLSALPFLLLFHSAAPSRSTSKVGCRVENVQLDIVFAIDASRAVGKHAFAGVKAAVSGILHVLSIGQGEKQVRVAFVRVDGKPEAVGHLTSYKSSEEAVEELLKIPFAGSMQLNLAGGVNEAQKIFNREDERPKVPNLIILLSSSTLNCYQTPNEALCLSASSIAEQGTTLATVALRFNEDASMAPFNVTQYSFWNDRNLVYDISKLFCTLSPFDPPAHPPRPCPCVLDDLWLDIVFVFDSSTNAGRYNFAAQRGAVIGLLHRIRVNQKLGMSNRIAFVNLGDKAHRVSNLTSYEYIAEAVQELAEMKYMGSTSLNLNEGLLEAQSIFEKNDKRKNVKNVVVVFTNHHVYCDEGRLANEAVCLTSTVMKDDGITIMTADVFLDGVHRKKSDFGSACFRMDNGAEFMQTLEKNLCTANCFCQPTMRQFKNEEKCEMYGECVYLEETSTGALSAKTGCSIQEMTLADVRSPDKNTFLTEIAVEENALPFYIGLVYRNGSLVWDTGAIIDDTDFQFFKSNGIDGEEGSCTSVQSLDGRETAWISTPCTYVEPSMYYFCQKATCDTVHYCETAR